MDGKTFTPIEINNLKTINKMTNNQQNIINSLISEFDKINKSKKVSNNNLLDFISNQLDEISVKKQEFREQTRMAKIINDELLHRLTADIQDLLDNFGYTLEVREYKEYCRFYITFVGELDKRYNCWEHKDWYAHKYTGWLDNEDGLRKGGFELSADYRQDNLLADTDALLEDIAKHIVQLKKRKL
jgi:hypothetical protein